MLRLFNVIENKIVFVEFQLPQSIKIHNIFHPNLFQKVPIDFLTNQVNKLLLLVIINNKKKWEVENNLDTRSY